MHVILLVLTIFFNDAGTAPRSLVLRATTEQVCKAAGPQLKAEALKDGHVRDVAWTCIEQDRADNA